MGLILRGKCLIQGADLHFYLGEKSSFRRIDRRSILTVISKGWVKQKEGDSWDFELTPAGRRAIEG